MRFRIPIWLVSALLLPASLGACATGHGEGMSVHHAGAGRLGVRPARVAVVIPSTGDPLLLNAYTRLDVVTDQLFQQGLGSHVVERTELPAVHTEQLWQYAEPTAEDTQVRLGRLSGADALVLYRIKGPELRERLFVSEGAPLSPITISAKVIRVETGEEVWSQVVTVELGGPNQRPDTGIDFDPAVWKAVDRGVDEMLAALAEAMACELMTCDEARATH